jgi:cytoskeletal protein CcmA (bactofilin family)
MASEVRPAERVTKSETSRSATRDLAVAVRDGSGVMHRPFSLTDLGVRNVIDESGAFEGSWVSSTSFAIKGQVKGDVRVRGDSALIIVYPGAKVEGLLRARFLWIAGEVSGRLECQRLLMLPGGRFEGESQFESIEIKHGADYFPCTSSKQEFDCNA